MEAANRKGKEMIDQEEDEPTTSSSSDSSGGGGSSRSKRPRRGHGGGGGGSCGKGKEEEIDDQNGGDLQDPLVVLGSDIMLRILNCLDAQSVALCISASRGWREVASDDKIWSIKLEELWRGKAHIPRVAKLPWLSKLAAYRASIKDGKRNRITKDDLIDHAWEFHFTEEAPDYWRNLDPFWTGEGPPMRRYFHSDGSLSADPGDRVWGGHESCFTVITGFIGDGTVREHYVRINRWPPMLVTRKPDWSWEMRNKIYIYNSVPDADKEDGTGPLCYSF